MQQIEKWAVTGDLAAGIRAGIALLAWCVVLGALALLAGCGATPRQQHAQLNTLTDVADPTYALAIETCRSAFRMIYDREGTTYEQDIDATTDVAEVCRPIVAGFETLRGTQLTARQAIDNGATGAVLQGIQEALRLWARLRELIPQLRDLGTSGGAS